MDVSLERVLSGCRKAFFQARRSRESNEIAGALLGGVRDGVLHLLDDARILFDALLSGICAAFGIRDGAWRDLGKARNAGDFRDRWIARFGNVCCFISRARHAHAWRYLLGA